MPSREFSTVPVLRLLVAPATSVEADLLVIPVFAEGTAAALPDGLAATVATLRESRELKGEPYEMHWLRADGLATARVLLLGAGAEASLTADVARRLGTAAGLAGRGRGQSHVAVVATGEPVRGDNEQGSSAPPSTLRSAGRSGPASDPMPAS